MTVKVRARLFQAFIILFVILTITTSLYAAGYRLTLSRPFSWSEILQKTGLLQVDTKPNGAKIYLEKHQKSLFSNPDKYRGETITPAKITHLIPGKYDLTVELDGYWSWEKEIEIQPGQAIYFEDIVLFKKTLPLLINPSSLQETTFSPNNHYAFLNEDKVILDLDTEETFALPEEELSNWQWSSNDNQFVTDKYTFKPTTQEINWLNTKDQINNLKCFKNNKQIFYQNPDSISQFNLSSQDISIIASDTSCQDYFIYNNRLITINTVDNRTHLKVANFKNEKLRIIELPYSNKYKFIDLNNGYINVWQEDYESLYVINIKDDFQPIKARIDNLKYVIWLGDDQLLYANDSEILFYDLNLSQSTLITRVSTQITKLLWHPAKNYIIFSSPDSLYVIDWQKRDYTITKIITLTAIESASLDYKQNQLYFSGEIGQQSGIYKLSL